MRCLYCGKELALLKRWTGGGEFCSDAHRQQYQEEYNQLALNRLLQAKPRGDNKPEGEAKTAAATKPPETKPSESGEAQEISHLSASAPTMVEAPEPVLAESSEGQPEAVQSPEAAYSEEEPAPANPAGFLVEMPAPVMADVSSLVRPETELERRTILSLPSWDFGAGATQLAEAGRVTLEPAVSVSDYGTHPDDRRVEIREFVRAARVIGFDSFATSKLGLGTSENPMEVLVSPFAAPQPQLWQAQEIEFGALGTELGALARVVFQTTGLEDNEIGEEHQSVEQHRSVEQLRSVEQQGTVPEQGSQEEQQIALPETVEPEIDSAPLTPSVAESALPSPPAPQASEEQPQTRAPELV
jgi:hypothetical protein